MISRRIEKLGFGPLIYSISSRMYKVFSCSINFQSPLHPLVKMYQPTYKNLLDFARLSLGLKIVNFCHEVLQPLGSYRRVFTVFEISKLRFV